jgi:hypothetical protein
MYISDCKAESNAGHSPESLDSAVIKQRCRKGYDISEYKFWGERLQILHEFLLVAEPVSFRGWISDWRQMDKQWKIGIVAVSLTAVFGLVQIILQGLSLQGNGSSKPQAHSS